MRLFKPDISSGIFCCWFLLFLFQHRSADAQVEGEYPIADQECDVFFQKAIINDKVNSFGFGLDFHIKLAGEYRSVLMAGAGFTHNILRKSGEIMNNDSLTTMRFQSISIPISFRRYIGVKKKIFIGFCIAPELIISEQIKGRSIPDAEHPFSSIGFSRFALINKLSAGYRIAGGKQPVFAIGFLQHSFPERVVEGFNIPQTYAGMGVGFFF